MGVLLNRCINHCINHLSLTGEGAPQPLHQPLDQPLDQPFVTTAGRVSSHCINYCSPTGEGAPQPLHQPSRQPFAAVELAAQLLFAIRFFFCCPTVFAKEDLGRTLAHSPWGLCGRAACGANTFSFCFVCSSAVESGLVKGEVWSSSPDEPQKLLALCIPPLDTVYHSRRNYEDRLMLLLMRIRSLYFRPDWEHLR